MSGNGIGTGVEGKFYSLTIDGEEYQVEESQLTGAQIMDLGGIPYDIGLLRVLDDGTQVKVAEDEVVELKPGRRFRKQPRFVRG